MPEVIIKYEKPEELALIQDFANDLHLEVKLGKDTDKYEYINGVAVRKADPNASIDELRKVFSGKEIDAAQLRKDAWKRRK